MNILIMDGDLILAQVWFKPSISVPRVGEKVTVDYSYEQDGVMNSHPTMGYVDEVHHNFIKDELQIKLRDVGEADDVV